MKYELILDLFRKLDLARFPNKKLECWSARELQRVLGYAEWRNFLKVLQKAKIACENSGVLIADHFVDINKMIAIGKGGKRKLHDIALTRYACFLIAQNGDPLKNEIAFAQTYFALQTRKLEIIEQHLLNVDKHNARNLLLQPEYRLSRIIYEHGVDEQGIEMILDKGDKALFGGNSTQSMKKKLKIPKDRVLSDFLAEIVLTAKHLAAEVTSYNVINKGLRGAKPISIEHVGNNRGVRKMLVSAGIKPETLPPSEEYMKRQGELEAKNNNLLKNKKRNKA